MYKAKSVDHPNSHVVTIRRNKSMLENSQRGIDEYFKQSSQNIGSFWKNTGSTNPGTGLFEHEVLLLMPIILEMSKEDREFRKSVADFFHGITTKVPYDGLELQVGLSEDNDKPVSETNLPLETLDYIRYRHAKGHPTVGLSPEDAKGNQLKEYYIEDPEAKRTQEKKDIFVKDEALTLYLKIKGDNKQEIIDSLLVALGQDPSHFMDEAAKTSKLRDIAESKPADFLKEANNPDLVMKAFVGLCVKRGVLNIINMQYFVASTGQRIGSEPETIMYLKDAAQSEMVGVLKAQLQEQQRNLKPTKKKTQSA